MNNQLNIPENSYLNYIPKLSFSDDKGYYVVNLDSTQDYDVKIYRNDVEVVNEKLDVGFEIRILSKQGSFLWKWRLSDAMLPIIKKYPSISVDGEPSKGMGYASYILDNRETTLGGIKRIAFIGTTPRVVVAPEAKFQSFIKKISAIEEFGEVKLQNTDASMKSCLTKLVTRDVRNDINLSKQMDFDGHIEQFAIGASVQMSLGDKEMNNLEFIAENIRVKIVRNGLTVFEKVLPNFSKRVKESGHNNGDYFGQILGGVFSLPVDIGKGIVGLADNFFTQNSNSASSEFKFYAGISDHMNHTSSEDYIMRDILSNVSDFVFWDLMPIPKIALAVKVFALGDNVYEPTTLFSSFILKKNGLSEFPLKIADFTKLIFDTFLVCTSNQDEVKLLEQNSTIIATSILSGSQVTVLEFVNLFRMDQSKVNAFIEMSAIPKIKIEDYNKMLNYVIGGDEKFDLSQNAKMAAISLSDPIPFKKGDSIIITGIFNSVSGARFSGWSLLAPNGWWAKSRITSEKVYFKYKMLENSRFLIA